MKYIIFLSLILPQVSLGQPVKFRKYEPGETYRYKLTTEVFRSEKFASKSVSVSEHRVVKDSGILSETVKWISKITYNGKDTVNLDSLAQKVAPYNISLSQKGKVLLPKLNMAEMTGDITDLNTFFVAIAPALNAQKLSSQHPTFVNEEFRHGNFADGREILQGADCLQVTQKLIETNKQFTIVETSFRPPPSFCLKPLSDTSGRNLFDQFYNIEFVRRSTGDKVNYFWGVETFTITTKLDNASGQITEASMINRLNLKMRYNASPDLKTHEAELPITIRRALTLELLK